MNNSYQIKLPQFEGPFDLLLFFIERDELDIYNIPITGIINDFLHYIHEQESLNIELSSEFILFISTLMRIKAKMLLPRKELDAQGNEIDPRQELINKILQRPGESVLVIGHSNWMPDVIRMLGGDTVPTIDEQRFDDLFVVTVYAKGKAKVAQLKYGAP